MKDRKELYDLLSNAWQANHWKGLLNWKELLQDDIINHCNGPDSLVNALCQVIVDWEPEEKDEIS